MTHEPHARFRFPIGRIWDVLAVCVVAYAAWKIFAAPRAFTPESRAHPAPHATFVRLDGAGWNVTDARGRVLFLDFYATWCEPCRIELPMVAKWAARHPEAMVTFVDVGEPRVVAAPFAKRYKLGNVALDPRGDAQGIFALGGFPTVVVVDPAGRTRAAWEGLNPAIGLALDNAQRTLAPQ